ncbi:hypothetical protein CU044_7282 [Streptomyces sp. L-9-10]|nr:hypothetical protein CU044_7282 [Streptomyces sp. L-9-10]
MCGIKGSGGGSRNGEAQGIGRLKASGSSRHREAQEIGE